MGSSQKAIKELAAQHEFLGLNLAFGRDETKAHIIVFIHNFRQQFLRCHAKPNCDALIGFYREPSLRGC